LILIDSSAWIEFLRGTRTDVSDRVRAALIAGDVASCDPVRMEVLAGARDESHLRQLRGLLARATTIEVGPTHHDEAAALYRRCRRQGESVRRMLDCLIAAAAIAAGIPILHADADFEVLARHTSLTIA
jgi:predicted nucleic acid-binding protein